MAQITGNTCEIVTIFPMEVECKVTNASTPLSTNGSVEVLIQGGTGPYTITWNNGQNGSVLTGLSPGTYSATVVDYYGDYTVTTNCVVDYDNFYLDRLLECADISSPNLYVFYDGTSLDETKAVEASESIRTWYSGKTDEGFGGLLYEGVVGQTSNNGENWLWWGTYPYLGSLTGGTLSDGSEVKLYGLTGETVSHSEADSRWCTNSSGECNPKNVSFNFENDTYQRINRGQVLTGFVTNDDRSQGLPFDTTPSSLNGQYEDIFGDFIGGDTNYIVICVADEADGVVGLYHGRVGGTNSAPAKSDLYNDPFTLKGNGWDTTNTKAPSDRYVGDYERFLKVWEDIVVNEGGSFNGLVYPVCDSNITRIPFVQHSVATIEGTTITSSEYTTKYGGSITNVGPENLNLSALTRTNVYTALTSNSVYTSLPAQYQQGAGLKNFGWEVDPDVTNFTTTVVGDALDEFFSSIQLSDNEVFVTQGNNFSSTPIYSFNEIDGCYQYDSQVLYTGQSYSAVTISSQYDDCIACQPSPPNLPVQPTLCLTDGVSTQYTFTPNGVDGNNNFVWINSANSLTMSYSTSASRWVVTNWNSIGSGTMQKLQSPPSTIPTGSWTNYGSSSENSWSVNIGECVMIPLTLTASPSDPTCVGQTGSVTLNANGGYSPYQYKLPSISSSYQNSGLFTSLQPGTYLGEVLDNSGNTATTNFIINTGINNVNYAVGLTRGTITPNLNPEANSLTTSYNYTVTVNPTLPTGIDLTFKVKLSHTKEGLRTGDLPLSSYVQFSHSFTVNKNNASVTVTDTNFNSDSTGGLTDCNEVTSISTFESISNDITISNGDVVNGSVSTTVDLNELSTDCDCQSLGDYDTTLQIVDVSIEGGTCATASAAITPLSMETKRRGCNPPSNCYTYSILNDSDIAALIRYTACGGNLTTATVNGLQTISVCSSTTPTVVGSSNNITITATSNTCT